MSCCGQKRAQFYGTNQTRRTLDPVGRVAAKPQKTVYYSVYFQYLGKTGLTVIGPRTGNRYRFDKPGVIVEVDLMDRLALAIVPNLRQVRNS
jgi:hypothetical protein